jgi:hypothetical protein
MIPKLHPNNSKKGLLLNKKKNPNAVEEMILRMKQEAVEMTLRMKQEAVVMISKTRPTTRLSKEKTTRLSDSIKRISKSLYTFTY